MAVHRPTRGRPLHHHDAPDLRWTAIATDGREPQGKQTATTDRPDLQKALRAARAGLFDTLLVYRVDRFSRSLRDLTSLLDDLADADIVFRSATEPFDTSTPVGRMLVQMLGVFAEFERETIIDRVISGMERKAAKGLWTGGARPLGSTRLRISAVMDGRPLGSAQPGQSRSRKVGQIQFAHRRQTVMSAFPVLPADL